MDASCKILLLTDFFRELFRLAPSSPVGSSKKRILLVRTDRLGDFALFLPFMRAIRHRFPEKNYHLALLGNRLWLPLAEAAGGFDEYISIAPGDFILNQQYRQQVLTKVRQGNFDTIWQWRYFREPWVEGIISLAAGKRAEHTSFAMTAQHPGYRFGRIADMLLKQRLITVPADTHEILKNLLFWQKISGRESSGLPAVPPLSRPEPVSGMPESYTVILPGTGKAPECRWGAEKFHRLLKVLPAEKTFIITGTPEERKILATAAGNMPNCRIVCNLDILSFSALIANAEMVIGNDTGGIHLAALYGVPSVAISGAGQPGWFLPYPERKTHPVMSAYPGQPEVISGNCTSAGCNWLCRMPSADDGGVPCISSITVESVAERVRDILANRI